MKSRLYKKYVDEVRPSLMERRKYNNVHQVPYMEKIVINMGISAAHEKGAVEDAARDLSMITGRKAVITKSRKSIANFKLREGQPNGCFVTLRQDTMYEFFDRLVAAALPRIRDFRGVSSRSFDGRGNYSLGLNDHVRFLGSVPYGKPLFDLWDNEQVMAVTNLTAEFSRNLLLAMARGGIHDRGGARVAHAAGSRPQRRHAQQVQYPDQRRWLQVDLEGRVHRTEQWLAGDVPRVVGVVHGVELDPGVVGDEVVE